MVLDASKTNVQQNANQLTDFSANENGFRCVQNQSQDKLPIYSSSEWFWMRPKPTLQENANQFTDFSANENGFGCIQNQSLDKCKQISQDKADENCFGCVQNQPASKCKSIYRDVQNYPREMQTNSLILAKDPQTNENKSVDVSAFENCFRCVQNQSLDKCKQISQFKAHENGFGCVQNQPASKCKSIDR